MSYAYLTDEVIQEFPGLGSETLVQYLANPDNSPQQAEEVAAQIFTEILLLYQDNKLSKEAISEFLSLAVREESTAVLFCNILDVFPTTDDIQDLLVEIYTKQSIIKYNTLAQNIDIDALTKLKIIPQDVLNRQLNTRKRDEFYTQKKFNLLHEELDGYSKLIVELYSIFKGEDTEFQLDYALSVMDSLIGHYSLDPNRVLDIILDIYTNCFVGNHKFAIQLLKKSKWWPHIESDNSSIESLSVGGNEAAAKCIGLKLVKHQKDKDLPETFKILIACLIKEGFISFSSIWKYVRPEKDGMKALEAAYKKDLDEKVFKAGASALALAAPLLDEEDGEDSAQKKSGASKETAKEESLADMLHYNFKFQLLRVFVGNGLYWPSIYILTQYPFLVHVDEEISVLLCRLLNAIIDPLYQKINSFTPEEAEERQKSKKIAFSRPQNTVFHDDFPCTDFLSFKPTIKSFSLKKFHYFYDEWTNDLPVVDNVDDLIRVSREFLKFVGVNLSKDVELFSKLCDIIVDDLKANDDQSSKDKWFAYFRNFIFPSIPLIQENSFAVDKAYEILKFFKVEERFNLYGELYQVLAKNNPHIKMAYGRAEKATKDVLKRLSKENVRPMMRRLAKISFSNPLPCFLTILQQIESYDNLNTLVVETARYFNPYGWDVLTLAILLRLTASGRSNTQVDGLNERQWIQSLASFIGKICQRYPSSIDLQTICSFIVKSFHGKETSNLIVLKEMLISMGGIQATTNLNMRQVDMINCGSSMEKIVYKVIDDLRYERVRSGSLLLTALDDTNAVNGILILLCQLNDDITRGQDNSPLKVLTSKNDELNTILHLYTQMVSFFSKDVELHNEMISISELVNDYGVPVPWAYEFWRFFIAQKIEDETFVQQIAAESESVFSGKDHGLSTKIFSTFWQLSLHDINFSEDLYADEISRLESQKSGIVESITISKKDRHTTRADLDKHVKQLEQVEKFIADIPAEKELHQQHSEKLLARLEQEKASWFEDSVVDLQMQSMLKFCFLPRAIHSSFDATFSARFLIKLHELGTPNFSLLTILDELMTKNILFGTLFTLTPSEAENLGYFFAIILNTLLSWNKESEFEKVVPLQSLDFDAFRVKLFTYHESLLKDISRSLEVDDYMCRRNAITFVKNLVGVFPVVEDQCEELLELLQAIATKDHREDLKLSSSALIGHVKSKLKDWVHMWEFTPMSDEDKEAQVKKREEIKNKIEAAKKLEADKRRQEQEEIKKAETKAKLEKEEAEKQKKITAGIKYDDSKSSGKRADPRGSEDSGRYDYYSKYGKSSKVSVESKPKETPVEPKKKDLKAKLDEAKREYQRNKGKSASPTPKAEPKPEPEAKEPPKKEVPKREPLPPQSETSRKSLAPAPVKRPQGPAQTQKAAPEPRRAPLPPQSDIRKEPEHKEVKRPSQPSGKGDTYYGRPNDRTYARYSRQSPAPRPGPPRAPASTSRAPLPAPSSRAPLPAPTSRPPLPAPSRPPPSAPGDRGRSAGNSRSTTPNSRPPTNYNKTQSQTNLRPPSTQNRPIPPPPPPPVKDDRQNYRYDKRKHDGYNGRSYEKKQRHQ